MYQFGNLFERLLRGGVSLAAAEQWLLRQLVNNLPPHLKPIIEEQIASYNLAQREADGRAINLYRIPAMLPETSVLIMDQREVVPLVRITVSTGAAGQIHATLTAVGGRVFCMAFSQPVKRLSATTMQLVKVKASWRSRFPAGAPNNSFKPNPLRGSA